MKMIDAVLMNKIPLYTALCLLLLSVSSCPINNNPRDCPEKQNVAIIKTSNDAFDNRYFDSLVVQKDNKAIHSSNSLKHMHIYHEFFKFDMNKLNDVEFPVHINALFFLRDTLLKELELEIPINSALTFYNGNECKIIPDSTTTISGEIYRYERVGMFYQDIQRIKKNLIDSSRSETICWVMEYVSANDARRCAYTF